MNSSDLRLKISTRTKDRVQLDDTVHSWRVHHYLDGSDRHRSVDRTGSGDIDTGLKYLEDDMYDSHRYNKQHHRYYLPLPPPPSSARSAWSRLARPLSPVAYDRRRSSPPPPYSSSSSSRSGRTNSNRDFTRAKSVGRCDEPNRKRLLSPANYDRRGLSPPPPYSSSSGGREFIRAKSVGRCDKPLRSTPLLAPILKKSTSTRTTSYNTVRSSKSVCKDIVEVVHRDRKEDQRSERVNGQESRPKQVSFKSSSSSSATVKKVFLAANKYTVGLFMDKVYSVFNITKRRDESYVKMRTPWCMSTAVYSNDKALSTTCTVYEYNTSREFALKFLRRTLRMDKALKVYSTAATTKMLKKTFARCNALNYSKLKEDIVALDNRYETVDIRQQPNRRSTTCLFRWDCKKTSQCVYCKLETLHNRVNERSGVRITKQMLYTDKRDSLLDKMVAKLINEIGADEEKTKVSVMFSSSSSSESSSSSSSSSSSESSSESSSSSSSSSECSSDECEPSGESVAARKKRKSKRRKKQMNKKQQQQSPRKKMKKNNVKGKRNTRAQHVEVSKTSITHTTETTKKKTLATVDEESNEAAAAAAAVVRKDKGDGKNNNDEDSNIINDEYDDYLCVSPEIDWNPDDA